MIELLNDCYMYLPKQEQPQKHHKSNEQKPAEFYIDWH